MLPSAHACSPRLLVYLSPFALASMASAGSWWSWVLPNSITQNFLATQKACDKAEVERPRFEDLPTGTEDPKWSAWGLWGADDEIGTLNLLTEERVKNAATEIDHGIVVPLK